MLFWEKFIFALFVRQEPFTKTKILLSACKVSKPHFNLAYLQVSSRPNSNRSLSTNLPLTAIAQAIQKIKVLYVSTGAWTGLQRKAKSRNNRFYKWPNPGYKASFNSRHTGTKCRDCVSVGKAWRAIPRVQRRLPGVETTEVEVHLATYSLFASDHWWRLVVHRQYKSSFDHNGGWGCFR